MDYPEDFNTSALPAGGRLALSRTVGIWIAVSLFLIICCGVAIPWLVKNKTIDPFVIYVNAPQGEWRLIGRSDTMRALPYYDAAQRALIGVFASKWFSIDQNNSFNESNWASCTRAQICPTQIPTTQNTAEFCGLYCLGGEDVYHTFVSQVMPVYQAVADFGDEWRLNTGTLMIMPNGDIDDKGGSWTLRGRVYSRQQNAGYFNVVAYVAVARDIEKYPQTLGFYVTQFNAYRE